MDLCFDLLYQLIGEGVDVTLIDRPECHRYFLSTYPDRSSEMIQQDNFTVLEHNDLPSYGTGLLDERITISCYERDSGTVHALIDTDAPAVREWAESLRKPQGRCTSRRTTKRAPSEGCSDVRNVVRLDEHRIAVVDSFAVAARTSRIAEFSQNSYNTRGFVTLLSREEIQSLL